MSGLTSLRQGRLAEQRHLLDATDAAWAALAPVVVYEPGNWRWVLEAEVPAAAAGRGLRSRWGVVRARGHVVLDVPIRQAELKARLLAELVGPDRLVTVTRFAVTPNPLADGSFSVAFEGVAGA